MEAKKVLLRLRNAEELAELAERYGISQSLVVELLVSGKQLVGERPSFWENVMGGERKWTKEELELGLRCGRLRCPPVAAT